MTCSLWGNQISQNFLLFSLSLSLRYVWFFFSNGQRPYMPVHSSDMLGHCLIIITCMIIFVVALPSYMFMGKCNKSDLNCFRYNLLDQMCMKITERTEVSIPFVTVHWHAFLPPPREHSWELKSKSELSTVHKFAQWRSFLCTFLYKGRYTLSSI